MEASTRPTPDELAALAPGDTVTIKSGAESGRTRRTAGTVARVTDTKAFVRVQSARGVPYVQEFSLRTGWPAGRANSATLVSTEVVEDSARDRRREQQRIDAL